MLHTGLTVGVKITHDEDAFGPGTTNRPFLRQVAVSFPVVSSQTPLAFQEPRNEYEIGPQGGLVADAGVRTEHLFLIKWSLCPGEFEPILAAATDFGGDHVVVATEGRARAAPAEADRLV